MVGLAAIPVYAVLRYGRFVWRRGRTGVYLAFAVLCYGTVAVANALRHLSDSSVTAGAWIDRTLFGGRFPVPQDLDQDRAHFFVMDAVVEETLELVAAALVVATVLAFARHLRQQEAGPVDADADAEPDDPTPGRRRPGRGGQAPRRRLMACRRRAARGRRHTRMSGE